MRLLPRHQLMHFTDPRSGRTCELRDPDGPATGRQLYRLNQAGLLALVEPGQVEPLSKGEAAWAVDAVLRDVGDGTAA